MKLWACENRDNCDPKERERGCCIFWMDRKRECFIREIKCEPERIMVACDVSGRNHAMKERSY